MLDIILARITDVLICLGSLSVYTCLVGIVLPTVMLRPVYLLGGTRDRGIKKYKYPEGRAVVYEPHPSVREYLTMYTLFVNEGAKYLRCMAANGIRDVKYTVVLFDNAGKVIDAITVEDTPIDGKMKSVILPVGTSYASVFVNRANGRALPETKLFAPDAKRGRLFFWVVSIMTVVLALIVRHTVVMFLETFSSPFEVDMLFVIVASFLLGALGAKMVISKRRRLGVI